LVQSHNVAAILNNLLIRRHANEEKALEVIDDAGGSAPSSDTKALFSIARIDDQASTPLAWPQAFSQSRSRTMAETRPTNIPAWGSRNHRVSSPRNPGGPRSRISTTIAWLRFVNFRGLHTPAFDYSFQVIPEEAGGRRHQGRKWQELAADKARFAGSALLYSSR